MKNKKNILFALGFVIMVVIITSGCYYYAVYGSKEAKKNVVVDKEEFVIDENEFVLLNNKVSYEMMSEDYWKSLRTKAGIDINKPLISKEDIEYFNYKNRKMISTGGIEFDFYEIGDTFNGEVIKSLLRDTTTDKAIEEEVSRVPRAVDTIFGFSVKKTNLKKLPIEESELQSDLPAYTPVVVIHESEDGEWFYILTDAYGGWVQKEAIAICEDKDDWLARQTFDSFIVVTGREIRLNNDNLLLMGSVMPIITIEEYNNLPDSYKKDRSSYGNYIAKLFGRDDEGKITDEYEFIPISRDVNLGYLDFTEENVLDLAFKWLGDIYGWAGDNDSVDCSLFTRCIYNCFGLKLPRTAAAQINVLDVDINNFYDINVSFKSTASKEKLLESCSPGSLLYFPGHIMMYIGSINGEPYCISSVGSFLTVDKPEEIQSVNTVVITNMVDTTRASGKSWIDCVEGVIKIQNE